MQVYLTALGCRLNEAELQTWAAELSQYEIAITTAIDKADFIILNTCAVTSEAARKSRQTIRKLHRQNPAARLVVTGCYVSLEQDEVADILGVDLIVSNQHKSQLPELMKAAYNWPSMPKQAEEPDSTPLFNRNRERAFIKIQDGCRYRCTYCIVTIARGEETSRSIEDILNEIRQLQSAGVKEIVLTGVHVGGYGADIDTCLYDLVVAILQQTDIPRIRFASVEPWDLPDNFFELFANKRLMPHMHLPIQSGSDAILRSMSRRCKSTEFMRLVDRARDQIADFNITSDIIAGFPGESENDLQMSLNIIEKAQFGHTHIFTYSRREGTKAARLPNQIDEQIKKQRSKQLHEKALAVKKVSLENMVGKNVEILFEGKPDRIDENRYRSYGYTENYHKAYLEMENAIDLSNQIISCKVTSADQNIMLLSVEPMEDWSDKNARLMVNQLD